MYSQKSLLAVFSNHNLNVLKQFRNIHVVQVLNQQKPPYSYSERRNADRSLFFTNWPSAKREKKPKTKAGPIPCGIPIIECKHKKLNHYSGMHYSAFQEIPLASKGWYHRRSKGDYFTILPSKPNPAFYTTEDLADTFEENGISKKVVEQLKKIGVTHPTVVQAKSIKAILTGQNILVKSECGSGKTLAYLIAVIENVCKLKNLHDSLNFTKIKSNTPLAIIFLPTRELALQVGEVAQTLCSELQISCETLIGGETRKLLLKPDLKPVDILICTPLVLQKLVAANLYSTELCKILVVDEADTLTEEGFFEQLKRFIKLSKLNLTGFSSFHVLDNCCQVCFVSATAPETLETRLQELTQITDLTTVSTSHVHKTVSHIPQRFIRVSKMDRAATLLKIVKSTVKQKIPTMIFCNSLMTSNWVSHFLRENGVNCPGINQTHETKERFRIFREFQEGIVQCISCTDVASRGLNFDKVRRVINFEFPNFTADYIHRCGRTGRLGQGDDCLIINFISSRHEIQLLNKIETAVRTNKPLSGVRSDRN